MHQADPTMQCQPPEARDYFLACYTVALVQGDTIRGRLIKHSTIKKYLEQAYLLFGSLQYTSPYNFVGTILKAVKDYEEVPNRRRMITDSMMHWLLKAAAKEGPDSSTRAIVDWVLLGRYAGFRAAEWSQTTRTKFARISHWPGKPSRAMTRSDFTFLGQGERHLSHSNINERLVRYLTITWRYQKNRQNGQQVTFGDDPDSPDYSATRAAIRIYHRSKRLGVEDGAPIAVFQSGSGRTQFITDSMVNALLRDAAVAALGLKRTDVALKLWSTHSIRVTAANLLYRQQLSDQYIMTRLRWQSPAFLVYLRNTIHSADAHSKAISVKLSPKDLQEASYRPQDAVEQLVSQCSRPAASAA